MKFSLALVGIGLVVCQVVLAQNVSYSKPELVNDSVGYIDTKVGRSLYRGSGTVVRDPRLIYTCAHIMYDRGVWARDYIFHRAIHQRSSPRNSEGADPRGFHYLTRYARAARFTDGESNNSFAADFVVLYGNSSFGPAARIQERSGSLLRSGRAKRIVGYPADIDFTNMRGFYYQHNTGWFTRRARRVRGPFSEFFNVSTGPGNSGGAIFLWDPNTAEDVFAGVLVSGSRRTAGVVAMNGASRRLADSALGSAAQEFRTSNRNQITLSSTRPTATRLLPVRNVDGPIADLSLSVSVESGGDSDPLVWLESPEGRVQRVSSTSTTHLSESFGGSESAGNWQLRIRTTEGLPTAFHHANLQGAAHEAEGE